MSTRSSEGLLFTTMPGASPTLSPTPEKNLQREKIKADTEKFLAAGGQITQLPKHASAWDEDAVEFIPRKMRGHNREQDAPDSGL